MLINKSKTKIMCISSAISYTPSSYLITSDGNVVSSGDTMKVLGFNFDCEPTGRAHLQIVQPKFKCRVWAIWHFKCNGFSKEDLVKVYVSMVRPIAEYCSAVFHTMITAADSNELDRIQMQALKSIYG